MQSLPHPTGGWAAPPSYTELKLLLQTQPHINVVMDYMNTHKEQPYYRMFLLSQQLFHGEVEDGCSLISNSSTSMS